MTSRDASSRSPRRRALLGYLREELLKRTIGELSSSDEDRWSRVRKLLPRALRGESLRFDLCEARHGAALWVNRVRVKPELAGERYLLAVAKRHHGAQGRNTNGCTPSSNVREAIARFPRRGVISSRMRSAWSSSSGP